MSDSRWRRVAGRGLGALLDLGCRTRYNLEVRGIDNFTRSPSTLVVFNHRRDADSPIIGNVLFGQGRRPVLDRMPIFIAREDLFRRGFLADYLKSWPPAARKLLSSLSLRPFLWALHAYPLRRIAERTLGEVLQDILWVFGDLPLDEVLKADWIERFEQLARPEDRPLRLGSILSGDRFRPLLRQGYGLTKLTRARFRACKPYERATIESQLQVFIDLLEQGETLQLAPEGAVSKDGAFARIRAGLHVLLNRPRALVRVLPVGITYDFMTAGRQMVFVNVGPEMTDLRTLRPADASARVEEAILAESTITASQLASQLLMEIRSRGGGVLGWSQLVDYVADEAKRWSKAGLFVDPRLLNSGDLDHRMDEYIDYCCGSGELLPQGDGLYRVPVPGRSAPPAWAKPEGAISYTNNELASVSRAHLGDSAARY